MKTRLNRAFSSEAYSHYSYHCDPLVITIFKPGGFCQNKGILSHGQGCVHAVPCSLLLGSITNIHIQYTWIFPNDEGLMSQWQGCTHAMHNTWICRNKDMMSQRQGCIHAIPRSPLATGLTRRCLRGALKWRSWAVPEVQIHTSVLTCSCWHAYFSIYKCENGEEDIHRELTHTPVRTCSWNSDTYFTSMVNNAKQIYTRSSHVLQYLHVSIVHSVKFTHICTRTSHIYSITNVCGRAKKKQHREFTQDCMEVHYSRQAYPCITTPRASNGVETCNRCSCRWD